MNKILLITAGIALTVMCWGAYGPVLHKGQEGLENSRLKPFICVGIAYFVVAIVVPIVMLGTQNQIAGGWSFSGVSWSLFAGTAGALGALGIVIALSSGGKPVYVMPIVFGCAPVINVFIAIVFSSKETGRPSPMFYAGLILVAVGAVIVLTFAPKPTKKKHVKAMDPPVATSSAGDLEA